MAGLSTVQVLLDDNSNTYPYDVSTYARLSAGWTITRGYVDETADGTADPGELRLRFDNTDGRFTLGSTTYPGIGGVLVKDQRIRVVEVLNGTSYTRFTGYVYDWPTTWESALGNLAYADVIAVDRLARYNRHTLRSMLEEEVLLDGPVAYYTLDEPAGALTAGDTSGKASAPMKPTGSGTPVVFGNATGPGTDGLTAAQLTIAQQTMTAARAGTLPVYTSGAFEMWVVISASNPAAVVTVNATGGGFSAIPLGQMTRSDDTGIFVDPTSGTPIWVATGINNVVTGPTSIVDGRLHHIMQVVTGNTHYAYLDGVLIGTTNSGSPSIVYERLALARTSGFTMSIAHVAIYPTAPSAARVKAHSDAGFTGFPGESASARVARLSSYASTPATLLALEPGAVPGGIAAAQVSGKSVADALGETAAAEGGQLFIGVDGSTVLHDRNHRPAAVQRTPAATLSSDQINPTSVTFAAVDYLVNVVTGSRNGGATQTARNDASVAKYEAYPTSYTGALLTRDELVLGRLRFIASRYGDPRPRLPALTLDLLSLPVVTVQALLALDVGTLVRIAATLPSQAPAGASAVLDLIVEGSREAQTVSDSGASWTLTLNTAPADLFRGPVVGTASATVGTGQPVYF